MLAFPFIYDKTIVDRIRVKAKRAVKEAKKAQPDYKPRSDSKKNSVAGMESLDGPPSGMKGAFGVELVKYMATMKVCCRNLTGVILTLNQHTYCPIPLLMEQTIMYLYQKRNTFTLSPMDVDSIWFSK